MRAGTRSRIQRTCSRSSRARLRTDTLAHTTRAYDETPGASIFCDARLRPPGPTGLRWLGCVAWRGRLASLESLFVPPRVPNRDRGTPEGNYEYNILSPVCFRTSGRHNVTEHSTDDMFPEYSTDIMLLGFLCLPKILTQKSP